MKIRSREDIAWVAGYYEGDGTCHRGLVNRTRNGYTLVNTKYNSYLVRIVSSDREPLDKVVSIMGFGKVYGPKAHSFNGKSAKPIYNYTTSGFENVQAFLTMVFPWLSKRRQEQVCDCLDKEYIYEYD